MPRITAASDKDAPRPFTTKTTGVSVSRATWSLLASATPGAMPS